MMNGGRATSAPKDGQHHQSRLFAPQNPGTDSEKKREEKNCTQLRRLSCSTASQYAFEACGRKQCKKVPSISNPDTHSETSGFIRVFISVARWSAEKGRKKKKGGKK